MNILRSVGHREITLIVTTGLACSVTRTSGGRSPRRHRKLRKKRNYVKLGRTNLDNRQDGSSLPPASKDSPQRAFSPPRSKKKKKIEIKEDEEDKMKKNIQEDRAGRKKRRGNIHISQNIESNKLY